LRYDASIPAHYDAKSNQSKIVTGRRRDAASYRPKSHLRLIGIANLVHAMKHSDAETRPADCASMLLPAGKSFRAGGHRTCVI
jgi:hypothetical protein